MVLRTYLMSFPTKVYPHNMEEKQFDLSINPKYIGMSTIYFAQENKWIERTKWTAENFLRLPP